MSISKRTKEHLVVALADNTAAAEMLQIIEDASNVSSTEAAFVDAAVDAAVEAIQALPANQIRYVDKSGNDANPGSQLSPFLTIKAALDSITDASLSKRYRVDVGPGVYLEANDFAMKEHVSVSGSGRALTRIGRLDGSVIPLTISAGYIPANQTDSYNSNPRFSLSDLTILNGFRASRVSSGVGVTDEFILGLYDCNFGTGPSVVLAGTVAIGSNIMTVSSNANLRDGMTVTGTGVPANTQITVKGLPSTQVRLSANATANNSTNKTFRHPSLGFDGAGIYTVSNFGTDHLDMDGCLVADATCLRGVTASSPYARICNTQMNGNIIVRDDGTHPQAFGAIAAIDSGAQTVTVAPGLTFNPGAGHASSYGGNFTRTGSGTSGSNLITGLSSTVGLRDGMTIVATGGVVGIPAATTITVTGQPAGTILLSANLTANLTFNTLFFSLPTSCLFSYASYDSVTGVFSGVVSLFGGPYPIAGQTITNYLGSSVRLESVQHARVMLRAETTDLGASSTTVDLLAGSFNGGNITFDGINARSFSDAAGLAMNINPTYINGGAEVLNLAFKSLSLYVGHIPSVPSNWSSAHTKVSTALDALAADKLQASRLVSYLSATSAGGGATEVLTVTGLLATDTILSVNQSVAGANNTAITAFGAPGAGSLSVTWTSDPGAGAVIRVLVLKV